MGAVGLQGGRFEGMHIRMSHGRGGVERGGARAPHPWANGRTKYKLSWHS